MMAIDGTVTDSDDFSQVIISSIDQRWDKYLKEVRRCQKSCSEKAVHDLRVATRRLISILELVSTFLHDPILERIRGTIRKRFKELGPLRDVQVQLLRAEKTRNRFPDIEPFFTLLLLREQRILKEVNRRITRIRLAGLAQQMTVLREMICKTLGDPSLRSIGATAAVGATAASYAKASSLLQGVDGSDPETIHRLRISFKKFRYMVEALGPVFPWASPRVLKAMNRYQVRMGEIQDIEVFSASLEKYIGRLRKGPKISFLPFQQQLIREHRRLIEDFMDHAGELYGFWKDERVRRSSSRIRVVA